MPTREPSFSPSYTPIITSNFTVVYSRESDVSNLTHYEEVIRGDDVELFQLFLADDHLAEGDFRYLQRTTDFEHFQVTKVYSEINKFISCTPENVKNACYRISTYVTVDHYPMTVSRFPFHLHISCIVKMRPSTSPLLILSF